MRSSGSEEGADAPAGRRSHGRIIFGPRTARRVHPSREATVKRSSRWALFSTIALFGMYFGLTESTCACSTSEDRARAYHIALRREMTTLTASESRYHEEHGTYTSSLDSLEKRDP